MTWPFENDTSAIVKKLADRSMKADKRRNAFIIITIAFAVSLMMVLALYNLGTDRENRLYLQGRYQSSFINSTSAVLKNWNITTRLKQSAKRLQWERAVSMTTLWMCITEIKMHLN